jgi:hypothetical protein
LGDEAQAVDRGVDQEEIHGVPETVRRSGKNFFPKIFSSRAAEAFLCHEDRRKEYDKITESGR